MRYKEFDTMRSSRLIIVVVLVLAGLFATEAALAWPGRSTCSCYRYPDCYPWHGGYYYTAWGRPVPLVVPPTADYQTHWGWGAGNTRITPICPQFAPGWAGVVTADGVRFRPTPAWPSDTDQYGVYYVRGPW